MGDKTQLSKYISLILRHHPEAAGINLDAHGWANVDELIEGINRTRKIDFPTLEAIVAEDKKGRYSFSEDKKLIRANQGHSIQVDVELEEVEPPEILYHGTGEKFTVKIDAEGLKHGTRLYVHLSGDVETARKVGQRHGKPVIYVVKSGEMFRDGYKFFKSVNGVWLTENVPVKYLDKITSRE
ncbi:MAG: RNA 2'-phosphotransferase [Synergistaceae bacterium]|nr:RNA 2'-phosphotransferase [Synergistaceae bacterium]